MLKTTSEFLRQLGFTSPGVLINEDQARANIRTMANKARRAGAVFRPHFKTHQSADVGRWFAEEGVTAITVSSVAMAEYFAASGWDDITIAFLLNPLEWDRIEELARDLAERGGRLAITVDSAVAAASVASRPETPIGIWIKMDTGYGRTGVHWQDLNSLQKIVRILGSTHIPVGFLTHSGHSYSARSTSEISIIWDETIRRMRSATGQLELAGKLSLSVGDTPCCRAVDDLSGVQEIRPGNFVFFDLMQWSKGICETREMAAAAICPVVGLYPERGQVVVHGGAVHLSREFLLGENNSSVFGYLGSLIPNPTGPPAQMVHDSIPVTSLSQEHGTVEVSSKFYEEYFSDLSIGDLVLIWPVHSCLLIDLATETRTMTGLILDKK